MIYGGGQESVIIANLIDSSALKGSLYALDSGSIKSELMEAAGKNAFELNTYLSKHCIGSSAVMLTNVSAGNDFAVRLDSIHPASTLGKWQTKNVDVFDYTAQDSVRVNNLSVFTNSWLQAVPLPTKSGTIPEMTEAEVTALNISYPLLDQKGIFLNAAANGFESSGQNLVDFMQTASTTHTRTGFKLDICSEQSVDCIRLKLYSGDNSNLSALGLSVFAKVEGTWTLVKSHIGLVDAPSVIYLDSPVVAREFFFVLFNNHAPGGVVLCSLNVGSTVEPVEVQSLPSIVVFIPEATVQGKFKLAREELVSPVMQLDIGTDVQLLSDLGERFKLISTKIKIAT